MSSPRILTGIKPTGDLHIGNYLGAIKPASQMIKNAKDCFLFVADYHALNFMRKPDELRENTYKIAAAYLAFGVDPEKTVFYKQSDIPEIFELTSILTALTPKGLMNRAHAYKAAIDKNMATGKTGNDVDEGINMGLYTYPILMAADILIADSDIVPVGKDQIQHVEMARDMARTFNHTYGDTLKLPDYSIEEDAQTVIGLDGRKMSKSYNNIIPLFETNKRRQKAVMKIITDSKLPEDPKDPETSTIFELYTQFADDHDIAEMRDAFTQGGMGYGDAKKLLAAAINAELEGPTELFNDWVSRPKDIDDILAAGATRVRSTSRALLDRVKAATGICTI